METKIEIKQLVEPALIAEQLARTNKSARAFVEQVGAANAMTFLQIFAGQNLRFPRRSTILKAAVVAYIRKELEGTYKGNKDRRDAVKKVQKELSEMGIHLARQQMERIFKAGKWVQ